MQAEITVPLMVASLKAELITQFDVSSCPDNRIIEPLAGAVANIFRPLGSGLLPRDQPPLSRVRGLSGDSIMERVKHLRAEQCN